MVGLASNAFSTCSELLPTTERSSWGPFSSSGFVLLSDEVDDFDLRLYNTTEESCAVAVLNSENTFSMKIKNTANAISIPKFWLIKD